MELGGKCEKCICEVHGEAVHRYPAGPYAALRALAWAKLGRGGAVTSTPGFCFFHLVRRFWNQIFT